MTNPYISKYPNIVFLVGAIFGLTSFSTGQITYYSALDFSLTQPALIASSFSTGPVLLETVPDHRFIDPGADSPDATFDRFYGGSILWNGGSGEWGASVALRFVAGSNPHQSSPFLRTGDGQSNWVMQNASENAFGHAYSSTDPLHFVIKVTDEAWNHARVSLYVDSSLAAAQARAFGGAVADWVDPNSIVNASLLFMQWDVSQEEWYTTETSIEVSNMFSAIPEPSTYALFFGTVALAFVWHRRRLSRRTTR